VYTDGPLSAYALIDSGSQQPILQLTPATLSFSGQAGSSQPATGSVSLTNAGGGTFAFTATSDSPWLTVAPASAGPPQTLQLTASFANLTAGASATSVDAGAIQRSPGTITVHLSVSQPSTPSPLDWPMVDHDPARSGAASGETAITPANAPNLKSLWSTALDGKVTAQPLFLKQVTVGGQMHDVVIAATNANSVYALDAGTGAVLWRKNFGAVAANCAIPGGFGITGAPAADKVNGLVYTVSDDGFHTPLGNGADAILGGVARPR
jgi:outer membrane protein assembly factor BamB